MSKKEIKILGDGCLLFCEWCKATKSYIPKDCDYCFKAETLPGVEIKYDKRKDKRRARVGDDDGRRS